MPTILDFQIQPLSAESYSLTICERGAFQPLASATFSHLVDFLTDFSVDRLNAPNSLTKDAAERFDELQKLGRELYQKLFPPAIEQVWHEYKQRSEFLILCLRFAEDAAKLEVLPWETLHDGAEFIAAGHKTTPTTLTRLPLDVAPPSELPPIPRPLRLFGFFASPLDLGDHERLNAEREQEILLEAINDPAGHGRISADFEDEAKLEILTRSLRDGYHILHFTGHGISPRDGGGLLLEDAHGKKLPASIAEVMQAVQRGQDGKAKLRLAVISGCQTARTLHTGAFSDLARELLRQRVPAVIAMQFSISDEGGLKFAEVLYRQIAKGVELERAVHAARHVLLADERFFINNDALAIVLLAADGACLQTTEAQSPPPQAEPGAAYLGDRLDPLAQGFYGRRREYRKIRDALLHQDQRAVITHGVIIHGMGGIGKTALLTHAINRLRPRFKDVMSFDCRRAALAPETILLELHRYFATQGMPELQSLIGQNVPPETLVDEIAKLLTEWPLLIVFDNFESQLNERRAFLNEDLHVFLTALLRATAMGSRFLFTARYLFDLGGERPGNLQELPLGDLSRPEALMLMQKLPNLAQAAHRDKLALLEKFGAHPFSLVTCNKHCQFSPLAEVLDKASRLHTELREYLGIELNCASLSDRSRELLYRLAAFRQPVPTAAAEWMMGNKIPNLEGEIQELIEWGMLMPVSEDGEVRALAVHSLVREFCRDRQAGERWRLCLREAATFYTDFTQRLSDEGKDMATVGTEMEAFELLMEAEEYAAAADLVERNHGLLFRWGFGSDLESWYRRVIDKVRGQRLAMVTHNLAMQFQNRGEYDKALVRYEQSLRIAEELGDRAGIAISLHNIGALHEARGEYGKAQQCYGQSLLIAEELGNHAQVAGLLHQLGILHQARGEYGEARRRYEQSLRIKQEIGDNARVATSLHQLGKLHQELGEYDEAKQRYEQSLLIAKELGNRAQVAGSHGQLGILHQDRGEYRKALSEYEQALPIFEELGDRVGIAALLHEIGILHRIRGEYGEAQQRFEQSLQIKKELGNRAGIANSLHELGNLHSLRGEYGEALDRYKQSLRIREELGDRAGVAGSLAQIGHLFTETGQYEEAFNPLLNALATFLQLQSPNARIVVNNLKTLRARWGEQAFDSAWRAAKGGDMPDWLTDESEATAS